MIQEPVEGDMKAGDLVRHRFEGSWDEIGLITSVPDRPYTTVSVMWHNSDIISYYRMRDLEIVK